MSAVVQDNPASLLGVLVGRSTLIEYGVLLPKIDFQAQLRSMLKKSA